MPIIINELVFKGEIAPERDRTPPPRERQEPVDKKAIVAACVDEIMRLLERQKER